MNFPNELILIIHTGLIGIFTLLACSLGKEALIGLLCTLCILANLFVVKQTTLFGLTATTSDALAIGAMLTLNLLQEYYGKESARRALWISVLCLIIYALLTPIQLWYTPHAIDAAHTHFAAILSGMPRIVFASLATYFIVQQIDRRLYAFLQRVAPAHFLIRNYISLLLCQLLDTVLFAFLGLYGIIENLGHIIMISYLLKIVAILMSTPFLALSRRVIRQG